MIELKQEELLRLEAAILTHVVKRPGRKRSVVQFLFNEMLKRNGKRMPPIQASEVIAACPGEPNARNPKDAFRTLITDLKSDLAAFFRTREGQQLPFRMTFKGEGNYLPLFVHNSVEDYVPLFWAPYLSSDKSTRLMYPEPFFVLDKHGTNLRNSDVNSLANREHFRYLNNSKGQDADRSYVDTLEVGYSYIPAGIVQGMFFVVNALARHARNSNLKAEPVMPTESIPPDSDELIVLATPTSITDIVRTLEAGLRMQTTNLGVRIDDDTVHSDKEENAGLVKWGLLTRRQHRNRTVTLISANHGRTVEAIAQALTINKQLSSIAAQLDTPNAFLLSFQSLFRVRMSKTREGPCIDETKLEKTLIIQ